MTDHADSKPTDHAGVWVPPPLNPSSMSLRRTVSGSVIGLSFRYSDSLIDTVKL
jgi:hypothetical protein